jgi:Protein of unknown function (DUF4238)
LPLTAYQMPDRKKQHFIPRFYLKNFSLNSSGKSLGIFNLTSSKFISGGTLKDQAYKDYFYGHDLIIEDSLSKLEIFAAKVLQNIKSQNSLSKISPKDHYQLLEFVIFLRERTVFMVDQLNESYDKFIKAVLSKDPSTLVDINKLNFELTHPTQYALTRAVASLPDVLDLSCKLIINKTKIPLITSDNPVVLYNQFLENRREIGSNTGLACKGLEIFLPLSPRLLLIFFDQDVYKIGNKGNTSADITDASDVNALNILQCINANHNLYFNEEISELQIRKLVSRATRYRRKAKANVDTYPTVKKDGKKYVLLYMYTSDVKCALTVSCISVLKKARQFKLKDNVVPVRDEKFCQIHDKFLELVEQGEYKAYEFYTFLRDVQVSR